MSSNGQSKAGRGGGEAGAAVPPPAPPQPPLQPSAAASCPAGPSPAGQEAPATKAPPAQVDTAPSAPKKARITKEAKAALYEHFSKINWPRNKQMPKVNTDTGLDAIINRFGLERKQASRQLRNWKGMRYDNTQVSIILNPEDIAATINDSISTGLPEFVTQTLDDIHEKRGVKGSTDATLFTQDLQVREEPTLVFIRDNPEHPCNALLVQYIQELSRIAGEEFPKRATELAKAELSFLTKANKAKRELVEQWKALHTSIALSADKALSLYDFGSFGVWLCNCFFAVWSLLLVEDEKATVEIPTTDCVGKYSRPVVYYVAGWALQRTSLALLVSEGDREKYHAFASMHSISKADAKAQSLPCSLVELKEKKKLFYVTQQFYDFVRKVESVYIRNLTLRMMMAHSGGDLAKCIDGAIRASDFIRNNFFALFGEDAEGVEEAEEASRLEIMGYILDRYIHMRGRWFVKFMKGNTTKSLGETRAAGSATRTKVAFACAQSKAVHAALREAGVEEKSDDKAVEQSSTVVDERQLWSGVERTVLEFEEEENANDSDGMDDYEYNSGDEE